MTIYIIAGLLTTYGVMRIFIAFMGNNKTHDRLGALINVFVYVIAVFLPFYYITGVVLFGLGALFLLSVSFEASILRRLTATASAFVVLIAVRAGLYFVNLNIENLVLFMLAALVVFAVSSIAFDISFAIDKKSRQNQMKEMEEKYEEEKTKSLADLRAETNGLRNYTVQHLKSTLESLDLYKLADVEASIKDLIARNKT